jgi:hypothetical protein
MSKPNKVNKDHYMQRGRLTPDEIARERRKQMRPLQEPVRKTARRPGGGRAATRPRSSREE